MPWWWTAVWSLSDRQRQPMTERFRGAQHSPAVPRNRSWCRFHRGRSPKRDRPVHDRWGTQRGNWFSLGDRGSGTGVALLRISPQMARLGRQPEGTMRVRSSPIVRLLSVTAAVGRRPPLPVQAAWTVPAPRAGEVGNSTKTTPDARRKLTGNPECRSILSIRWLSANTSPTNVATPARSATSASRPSRITPSPRPWKSSRSPWRTRRDRGVGRRVRSRRGR